MSEKLQFQIVALLYLIASCVVYLVGESKQSFALTILAFTLGAVSILYWGLWLFCMLDCMLDRIRK